MAKIWLLTDDRAGNVNQLLGIAEALGEPWERKEIRYNRWVRLPNLLRGAGLIGIDAPVARCGFSGGAACFPGGTLYSPAIGGTNPYCTSDESRPGRMAGGGFNCLAGT